MLSQSSTWMWSGTKMPMMSAPTTASAGLCGVPAVRLGARPALGARADADDDVAARLLQVQGVGVALRAVAEDRDPAAAQQRRGRRRRRSRASSSSVSERGLGDRQAITRMRERRCESAGGAADGHAAGADRLLDAVGPQQLLERDELVGMLDALERQRGRPDVDDARAEDLGERDRARRAGPGAAVTLTSSSSRSIASSDVSSLTLSTLISLYSCLMTWSIEVWVQSTRMRDAASGPPARWARRRGSRC